MLVFAIALILAFLVIETGIYFAAMRTTSFILRVTMGVLFVAVGIFVIAVCTILFGLTLIF